MADFTLPSGRSLTLKDVVTYGDVCDAQDAAFSEKRLNAYLQNLMQTVAGLSLDDIRALSPADGKALEVEIDRLVKGEASDAGPLQKAS